MKAKFINEVLRAEDAEANRLIKQHRNRGISYDWASDPEDFNWNEDKYKKWIFKQAFKGGDTYELAKEAEGEPGLMEFVQQTYLKYSEWEEPLDRIQTDIENQLEER